MYYLLYGVRKYIAVNAVVSVCILIILCVFHQVAEEPVIKILP
jgi:hypothetical protein